MEVPIEDDFVRGLGPAFLAHILKRLSDEMIDAAARWYPEQGISAPPRTASTLLALSQLGPQPVTRLADRLRQSHPLIIQWIGQLKALGLVESSSDVEDRRRSIISLTPMGEGEVERLRRALETMEDVSAELAGGATAPVYEELWEMFDRLEDRSFLRRLREHVRENLKSYAGSDISAQSC